MKPHAESATAQTSTGATETVIGNTTNAPTKVRNFLNSGRKNALHSMLLQRFLSPATGGFAKEVLAATNKHRRSNGKSELTLDSKVPEGNHH